MAKYHINEKGEPGLCKAIHNCRFGEGVFDHYPTPELAREAYEEHMNASVSFQKTASVALPAGFKKTSYVGPNGDIAIAEAYTNDEGAIVYRRAGSDDWQIVTASGRLLQAETPSGRYASLEEAAQELQALTATPNSKSIVANTTFEGTEEHQELKKEQLTQYLNQGDNAKNSLEASKYYWYALGLRGQGRGQEVIYNRYKNAVEKYEKTWEEGRKFDTSIEGPISLTNKNNLVSTANRGWYATPDETYMVYRKGAGETFSMSKNKGYWVVGSGPGSAQFTVGHKANAKKALVALHDLNVASRTGVWDSEISIKDAKAIIEKLSSHNPGGFPSSSIKDSYITRLNKLGEK